MTYSGLKAEKASPHYLNDSGYGQEVFKKSEIRQSEPDQTDYNITNTNTQSQIEERKRVYGGYCVLKVDRKEDQKRNIADLVQKNDGYVEKYYQDSIIVRVPADKFLIIFNTILNYGEILHKTIETHDVSDSFQDLFSRLKIADRTRERFYALLEKTKDIKERVKILKEIRRLTEEIENLSLQLKLIKEQIDFSRITVDLKERIAIDSQIKTKIPFPWINRLDPLKPSLHYLQGKIDFDLGPSFAVFTRDNNYRSENAMGVRVRIGMTSNMPSGDAIFWQNTVAYHLGSFYQKTELINAKIVKSVLFTSKDKDPFYYLIGIYVKNNLIYVTEVFFPDTNSFQEAKGLVIEALTDFEVKL